MQYLPQHTIETYRQQQQQQHQHLLQKQWVDLCVILADVLKMTVYSDRPQDGCWVM